MASVGADTNHIASVSTRRQDIDIAPTARQGFPPATDNEKDIELYSGDLLEGGRGEVWLTAGGTG